MFDSKAMIKFNKNIFHQIFEKIYNNGSTKITMTSEWNFFSLNQIVSIVEKLFFYIILVFIQLG